MKNLLASVGCFTVLVGAAVLGWQYRAQLGRAYDAFVGELPPGTPMVEAGPGRPTERALQSARRKQAAMAGRRGPAFVEMTASEMASLILEGLDPMARRALDSLTVTFEPDRFVLEAQLNTEVWGRQALGLFAGLLQAREPIRVAGPAHVQRPGVVRWEPDRFSIRSLPFPPAAIRMVVNSLTGGSDGAIWLAVPATVGEMRIRPSVVTFYRRVQ